MPYFVKGRIKMEIIFYIMLFAMGSVFGSFFTLAVYRIPLGLDITHERSFCPNCNHRLEFIDLIPIFSYLSLRGKCRYCGNPVRIRYLILEVISGIVFLIAYFAFKLSFPFFTMHSLALMVAFVMFYVTNAIILGIDKEYITIDKRVLIFGIITNSIYMLYLYSFESINLYRYGIYLVMILILFCFDTWSLKRKSKSYYLIQILMLFVYEISFINNLKIVIGILFLTLIEQIGRFIKLKSEHKRYSLNKNPIGFYIAMNAIISVLIGNIIL